MVLKSVTFLTMRASYIADEDHDDNNVDVTGSGLWVRRAMCLRTMR